MSHDIDILNGVTQTLIDSHKGYETCVEATADNAALQKNFAQRAQARADIIAEFQAQVRQFGGEPQTSGSAAGAVHRAWTGFTTLFVDDEKAAVEAIDDGEEFLVEKIADALARPDLTPQSRALLTRAHESAKEGERFADALDKAM